MAKNKKFLDLLKEKGLKPQRLADKLNVFVRSVEYWISGRNLPSVVQLFKLSKIFDKTVDELYWIFKNNKKQDSLYGV